MKFLSDKTLDRLREAADIPFLEGTRYVLMDHIHVAVWVLSMQRRTKNSGAALP